VSHQNNSYLGYISRPVCSNWHITGVFSDMLSPHWGNTCISSKDCDLCLQLMADTLNIWL